MAFKEKMIVEVDEAEITRAIVKTASEDWLKMSEVDVIVVGAGPSGLVASIYLAKAGLRTLVLERRLSFGGGIGGGGMMFHKIVVQEPAASLLSSGEIGCKLEKVSDNGVYVADTAAIIAKLANASIDAGAKILLGVTVDDLIYREAPPKVVGAVVQWSAVTMSGLHVDPLSLKSRAVVDCTGHDAEVVSILARKVPEFSISAPGEKSMWANEAERATVRHTGAVCPGLYMAGMAVAAIHQTPRMGPIFGGMMLSGKKVAELIIKKLEKKSGG